MSSFLGEGEDKHLGNNIPLRQSEQEQQRPQLQQQKEEKLSPFAKRILILDDDLDITLTFKKAFEEEIELVATRVLFMLIHITILLWLFRSSNQTLMI